MSSGSIFYKRKYDDAFFQKPGGSHGGGIHAPWRNAKNQKTFGSELLTINPTKDLPDVPKQVEFEIAATRPVKFNNQTRFFIHLQLQKKAEGANATWVPAVAGDAQKIMLAPNFFEKMLSGFDFFLGNNRVNPHVEHPLLAYELNSFLYYMMSEPLKKVLFPRPKGHPCIATNKKMLDFKSDEWTVNLAQKYYLSEKGLTFHYVPMHTYPFMQTPNFTLDCPQTDLPINHIGKMQFRFNFKDNYSDYVIQKAPVAENAQPDPNSYRFAFKKFYLLIEEDRQSPLTSKVPRNVLEFKGITREARIESPKNGDAFHRIRFLETALPEQMLIFAVHKDLVNGTQKYQDYVATNPYFVQHNIKKIGFVYDGESFTGKEPNFLDFSHNSSALKYMEVAMKNGICGVMPNIDLITYDNAINEYRDTLYPHVLTDFTIEGTRERIQPMLSDGTALKQDAPINITLFFHDSGSTSDAVYVIYFIFTDYSMLYDYKTNKFTKYHKSVSAM